MKLSEELRGSIIENYTKFWEANLSADMETFSGYLVDDFSIIGSANGEVFFSREEAVAFYTATADQMKGKIELRNRDISVQVFAGNNAVVRELCDVFVLSEPDWIFYGHARITCVLSKIDNEWKAIHQHASLPDHRTEPGQQIAVEKIERENLELREAIKRRTVELEYKNRELEIETALEKVRSRTMAMQHSRELADASLLLDSQVRALGIPTWGCAFNIYGDNESTEWFSSAQGTMPAYKTPRENLFLRYYEAGQKGEVLHVEEYAGEDCVRHYDYLCTIPVMGDALRQVKESGEPFPERQVDHVAYFKYGYLLFITLDRAPQAYGIFTRFANVFEQTYTRFLDLQKAEAQARAAQIEASLERVRSRAMAMQNAHELSELVAILFNELVRLDLVLARCIIWIIDEDTLTTRMWMANAEDKNVADSYFIKRLHHSYYESIIEQWRNRTPKWVFDLSGEYKKEIDHLLLTETELSTLPEAVKSGIRSSPHTSVSASFHTFGLIEASGPLTHTPEQLEILHRFGKVFDLSYTRFNDLQKAEEQARESQVETALERVRSRTLAMQQSSELAETAAVLFKQLIHLGIAPNRLYIGIVRDESGIIEFWVTDEDGTKVSTMFTGDANKNVSLREMFEGWKAQQKSLTIDMQGKELADYFHYLGDELHVPFKDGLSQKRRLQYLAYFSKGFIGVASPDEQPKDTIDLLERFASVFNLTFTRFNDLKIAEAHAMQSEQDLIEIKAARQKAEATLTELQSAQKQLIQSEKMASLGELTAGIAHEIQNPLNFVNNFSEVSKELLEEMKAALDTGNQEEAKDIAMDIIHNLEKIHHHGKRADAIVKGMLQHSRTSSTQKELADINTLADEYLHLAYHGLRAKDKTFNASFVTNYDPSIELVSIIPQDIGRVLLNLINNAFYAVSQSVKLRERGYAPTVSIHTKRLSTQVEVAVSDNGDGIPANIIDKIFQPFFTTKPSGQGTGLGLSLAYDIVKAHDGELNVDTKEGEYTAFTILLPKNDKS